MLHSQAYFGSRSFGFYTAASRSDDYVCGTGYRPISTHRNDLSSGVCLHAHDVTLQIIAQHSSTSNSVDPHHYCWMEPSPHYQQNFLHRKYLIQDVLTVQAIKNDIDKLGLGESPKQPVVFIGNHTAKCNDDCFTPEQLGTALTGRSMLEIGFSTEHGTGVKQQFIIDVLGVHYNGATPQQMKQSETLAESMPHWPDPGSVAEKDGIIIVNF